MWGEASHMSGPVGGAMVGALYQIPAIAASFGARSLDFSYAARFVAHSAEELRSRSVVPGVVFSINFPQATEAETRGAAVSEMGGMHLTLGYAEVEGSEERRFRPQIGLATGGPAGSDTEAYLSNMITITPLLFDWTAHSLVEEMRGWGLSKEVGRN